MREVLFRGKRFDNGEWVQGVFVPDYTQTAFYITKVGEFCHKVGPETVGQFTGLTDKNGTMIFEGDIFKGKKINGVQLNYVIWFDELERAFVYGVSYKGGFRLPLSEYTLSIKEFEVIGNIHDNPELLGGGADNG